MTLEQRPYREESSIEAARREPVNAFFGILEKRGIAMDTIAQAEVDFSYLTPEQRAETYWALYQEAKGEARRLVREINKAKKEGRAAAERATPVLSLLKTLHTDEETQTVFRENYDRHFYEFNKLNGNREQYQALHAEIRRLEETYDASARDLFAHRARGIAESRLILFEVTQRQLATKRAEFGALLEHNPNLGAHAMSETLKGYAKELQREHFIWSPSRRGALEDIEATALGGKPLLISGESGTGKTRLVEQAALALTGQPNAQTPGKDVRFQDLIAKPKIAPDGSTYYEFKEIGEAFIGKRSTRDVEPVHEGLLVADDEFNLLDESEQNTRLSRVSSWTPGKKVKMPVTNTTETIAPRALYCAMVNLASERYSRKRIPPEVLRKFGKIDLDYPPQTNDDPELYEMLLSALIDENGRLRSSREEIAPTFTFEEVMETVEEGGQEVRRTMKVRRLVEQEEEGGFLWRLANALNELNKSFSHRETALKTKGEAQYMKDLVLDVGTVLGWLTEYRTMGRQESMEVFVSRKIEDEFLSKTVYTIDDRQLLKEFLAHFWIATDDAARERIAAPHFAISTPREVGLLSPRVRYTEILSQEPLVRESYYIDDAGQRIDYERVAFEGRNPGDIFERDGERYEYLGRAKKDGELILKRVQVKKKHERKPESGVSVEMAQEILGADNFFGADALEKTFGVEMRDIPPIPFTAQELEQAKERGEMLILRTDTANDGTPLTAKTMNEHCTPLLQKARKSKVLSDVNWYKDDPIYTQETCRSGWALVGKELLAKTTSTNYLEQTDRIVEELQRIYATGNIPKEYQDAIKEFTRERPNIEKLIADGQQKDAVERLANLTITQYTRQRFSEALSDILTVSLNTSDQRILETRYTWTSSRSADGDLVYVGIAGATGAGVGGWNPDDRYALLGVLLSRRGSGS